MEEGPAVLAGTGLTESRNEAVEALAALGYSPAEALRAVNQIDDAQEMDVEALLKAALKKLL